MPVIYYVANCQNNIKVRSDILAVRTVTSPTGKILIILLLSAGKSPFDACKCGESLVVLEWQSLTHPGFALSLARDFSICVWMGSAPLSGKR